MQNRKFLVILFLSLIYLTISLACDPAAYRLIDLYGFTIISGSALIFSALYTLLDMLTRIAGRKFVYLLIVVFHVCDLIFSYILYIISRMPAPLGKDYTSLNMVLLHLPRLFWAGIIGAMVAGIVEVTIFAFLQGKFKNFFLASSISTIIILLAHNVPTEYFAFKTMYPEIVTKIVIANFLVGSILLICYTTIGYFTLKLINRYILNEAN